MFVLFCCLFVHCCFYVCLFVVVVVIGCFLLLVVSLIFTLVDVC